MKKSLLLLGSLVALTVAGCGGNDTVAPDSNILVSNDFETLAGWLPEPQNATLTREKAHSGRYALKVDGTHEYSLGFNALLGQLHETRITKIKVSAWVFVTAADAKAALVTAISTPGAPSDKPLLWESLDLSQSKEVGKWLEVSKVITLPANTAPTNALVLYLWRTSGGQPVYLDDLKVTVEP